MEIGIHLSITLTIVVTNTIVVANTIAAAINVTITLSFHLNDKYCYYNSTHQKLFN